MMAHRLKGALFWRKGHRPSSVHVSWRLAHSPARDYADAIDHLNSLQSPPNVIQEIRRKRIRADVLGQGQMSDWLKLIGYRVRDLNRLNIIHVAGTKGKGSVCAFANSILNHTKRAVGVPKRIGLYTSPHLITVRERIVINSEPISETAFARYFFEVWDGLHLSKEAPTTPETWIARTNYFRFLTIMAFHVFLSERVDAAVFEVGIGGAYDATNVIEAPLVTGITALGIEHVKILGDTLEKIAWQKAGIFKSGVPAFTVPQKSEAAAVLRQRAAEKSVELQTVAPSEEFSRLKLVPNESYQQANAALAVALVGKLVSRLSLPQLVTEKGLSELAKRALEQTIWRGRFEKLVRKGVPWYLDGAHTVDSLRLTGKWFAETASANATRVLIFNQQGRDNAMELLTAFYDAFSAHTSLRFEHVVFCTNATSLDGSYTKEQMSFNSDADAVANLDVQRELAEAFRKLDSDSDIHVMRSIKEATDFVIGLTDPQTLVTGSLHLVGGLISLLEPRN